MEPRLTIASASATKDGKSVKATGVYVEYSDLDAMLGEGAQAYREQRAQERANDNLRDVQRILNGE